MAAPQEAHFLRFKDGNRVKDFLSTFQFTVSPSSLPALRCVQRRLLVHELST